MTTEAFPPRPEDRQDVAALRRLRDRSPAGPVAVERRAFLPSEARFLLDASSILASSLDWLAALRDLTELVSPVLSDWCCMDIAVPGIPRVRVCGSGGKPDRAALLRELEESFPLDLSSPHPAARAIASGEAILLEDLRESDLDAFLTAPRHLDLARQLGARAVLSVPIPARGKVLGAMTLVQTTSPSFADATVVLARELGRRAGQSIDNSLLYAHAAAASKAKSDFLAVMSHELRTPLNSILGYVDLIGRGIGGPVTDQQLGFLGKIQISSRHLLQIIDEILTYSRMDAGRETVRVEPVPLAAVIAEVVAVAEPLARERGLRFEVADVPDVSLETDPQKVRQILLNLLTNAVKFTDDGWVRLTTELVDGSCSFLVEDSGRGIAKEDLERIFEPFWQVEEPRTRSRGGTGLGLAVSRRLCHMLGGTLNVESTQGAGASFCATVARRLEVPEGEPVREAFA